MDQQGQRLLQARGLCDLASREYFNFHTPIFSWLYFGKVGEPWFVIFFKYYETRKFRTKKHFEIIRIAQF